MSAAGTFRYFGAALETMEDALTPSRGDYLTFSVHEPLGVVAGITPWNSPDRIGRAEGRAGARGGQRRAAEARVLEPARLPGARPRDRGGRVCRAACSRPCPGAGGVVGERLVTHPAIRKVSFTGGTEVGRGIARKAAEKLMPVSLELGGKSPTIVFADCDPDLAIAGVLFGIFSSSGQSCIAGSRLFVERAIHDDSSRGSSRRPSACASAIRSMRRPRSRR